MLWLVLIVFFYVLYAFYSHDRVVRAQGFASADRGLRVEPARQCRRSVCFVLSSSHEWGQGFSQIWLTAPGDADAAVEIQHGLMSGSYSATVDVQLSGAGPAEVGLAVLREKRDGERVIDSWADELTIEVDDRGAVRSVDFDDD